MIKAVIFDCFGVLTSDGWLPFKQANFGDKPELMVQVMELNRLADAKAIAYDVFLSRIAELANVPLAQARA